MLLNYKSTKIYFFIFILIVSCIGCGGLHNIKTEITPFYGYDEYMIKDNSQNEKDKVIYLYFNDDYPQDREFIELAFIEITAKSNTNTFLIISALEKEALAIGADAVIKVQDKYKIDNNKNHDLPNISLKTNNQNKKTLTGIAIKFK